MQKIFTDKLIYHLMRIAATQIILLTLTLTVAFASENYAQELLERKITVTVASQPLQDVLTRLEQVASVKFAYSGNLQALTQNVSLNVKNKRLGDVLTQILSPWEIQYVVRSGSYIVLKKARPEVVTPSPQTKQEDEASVLPDPVTGTVTDTKGNILPGVSVIVKGTTVGTVTDAQGRYRISAREGDVIVFSFIGFDYQEVAVGDQVRIDVTLHENITELNDVVVTGYYTRKSESFTGAATTFTQDELKAVGNQNVIQSLAIIDPSFRIVEDLDIGSDPNQLPTIQIRGQSSLPDLKGEYQTNPNQPLFILNGFQATLQQVYDLNMNFVESITILKDAAAKAIYGSKAANGVVVIETRRPQKGNLRVSYTGSADITAPDLTSYHLTNSMEKIEAEVLAGEYTSTIPAEQAELTALYGERLAEATRGVNTYWLSQPLRVGVGQKHNVFLNGGDDAMIYSVNVSYNNIKGVMKGSDRTTLTGTAGLQYRYKTLSFRNQLTISSNKGVNSPYGDFGDYAEMNPYWRIHDEDGTLIKSYGTYMYNPLYDAHLNTKDFNKYLDVTENFYGEWAVRNNLRVTARIGVNMQDNRAEYFLPANHTNYADIPVTSEEYLYRGEYTITDGATHNILSDLGVSYSLEKNKHALFANAFYSIGELSSNSTTITAQGFPGDNMDDISMAARYEEDSSPEGSESTTRNLGVTAAFNYAYDNRFLVDFSYRMNASSQFGADNRWGGFWGAGAGWNLHKEKIIQQLRYITQLKLRASTGYTGSQNFSSYQSVATYSYNTNQLYNGDIGVYLLGLPNNALQWQRTQDNNVGIDLSLLNRLNLRFDYYVTVTDNLLSDVTTPPSAGFSAYKENIGKTENKGFQLGMSYKAYALPEKNAYVNLFFNLAHNTNKIKKISNALKKLNEEQDANKEGWGSTDEEVAQRQTPSTRFEEGQSLTTIWAVKSLGIDPANGQEVFVKQDGTLTYDWSAEDQIAAGDATPAFNGSFGANLQYKNVSCNLAFTFQGGGQRYNSTLVERVENADVTWNVDKRFLNDRWKEPGQESNYKDIADASPTKPTTRFVEDLNEVVFSSVSLYYDFSGLLRQQKINNVKLGFNMNDIGRLSTMKVERGTSYPFARVFSFSLQSTF